MITLLCMSTAGYKQLQSIVPRDIWGRENMAIIVGHMNFCSGIAGVISNLGTG